MHIFHKAGNGSRLFLKTAHQIVKAFIVKGFLFSPPAITYLSSNDRHVLLVITILEKLKTMEAYLALEGLRPTGLGVSLTY